ncbi:ATP-binding cassette domain-containing protein [Sulfitobacter sp. S223]|uniref:ATP-binding cassette domain-containing protein n=1 Tax=Sulfitobacter sp. S223 TaxID=2867023 RepID=UPI0021A34C2C|nr:ATP-binding cassette domain-containing protein [Sulfitobacter sp. S223]UWR27343.1 ATP-binding cassette domain-containing protein [Sulfitobacter sp. S223]
MTSTSTSAANAGSLNSWLIAAETLAAHFGTSYDPRKISDPVSRLIQENGAMYLAAPAIGEAFGKDTVFIEVKDLKRAARNAPLLCWSHEKFPFVIIGKTMRGDFRVVQTNSEGVAEETTLTHKRLRKLFAGGIAFEDKTPLDVWDADTAFDNKKNWFWGSLKPLSKSLRYLILAALIGNLLAVAASLFALQVWDRVIPAQSINSLTVLAVGVIIAVIFELILRLQRASLIDDIGREVDLKISGGVFAHMLDLKSDARPQSLGSMAAQIREINQIREAISSSMLSAAIDLPFLFIYVIVIYMIGGYLVYPILAAIPVVLFIGLIAQFPLARLAKAGLEEASLRNGLIVETVLKSDEIKLNQAENTMQLRWDRTIGVGNDINNQQRRWRNFLTNSTQSIQQLAYISVVILGAINVIGGDLTMGQVIACSILANRSIAPLAQVSAVMGAIQGSIIAKRSIDEMMKRDADTPGAQHMRRELQAPDISLKGVRYSYNETEHLSLIIPKLDIKYGEKVGIVGRIGSGKSTLLRLLSGLAEPSDGTALLDNTEMSLTHPADLRRAIGYQAQGSSLLRGTIRDNLLIARPSATNEEMMAACDVAGVLTLIKNNPRGLDLPINEAGAGLSGGQKQSLLLARAILRDPAILLLDEPTASMDDQTEATFIASLKEWASSRTVVIATHRLKPLEMCDRLVVINEGRIVLDGPKQEILDQLNKPRTA